MRPPSSGKVLVSQPVHQHAYQTALAAQDAGLLGRFVTGLYLTGRGPFDPRLRRLLPPEVGRRVERELRRRWHPGLDPELVATIPRHHLAAVGFGVTLGRLPLLGRFDVDTWAHIRFDETVARRLQRMDGIGIVHGFEGSTLATFAAARCLGMATVLDVPSAHEEFLAAMRAEGARPAGVATGDVRAERDLADYLLAPSNYVVECLVRAGVGVERIVKLPYGADPSVFRPLTGPRPTRPFRVLFVGQVGLRKGVHYLLEAWRRLNLSEAELVLVGQPDEAGRRMIREHAGACRAVGAVPQHEVHRWFQRSHVFAFPTLAEGSARVTYEAMAAGLPLVTTANSGSVLRDGIEGFLIPSRDVDALCSRLRFLYDHPEVVVRMGAAARASIVDRHTWRHYRRRVADIYQAILDDRPAAIPCSPGDRR